MVDGCADVRGPAGADCWLCRVVVDGGAGVVGPAGADCWVCRVVATMMVAVRAATTSSAAAISTGLCAHQRRHPGGAGGGAGVWLRVGAPGDTPTGKVAASEVIGGDGGVSNRVGTSPGVGAGGWGAAPDGDRRMGTVMASWAAFANSTVVP